MKRLFIASLLLAGAVAAHAAATSVHITLSEVESATLGSSPKFLAAQQDYESARHRALAQRSTLSPKLSLEATYRYQSVVPEFKPVPNSPVVKLGDNPNYSYGPQVTWTAFSSGNNYERWKASEASSRSAKDQWDAARRQALLDARLSYFKVRLGLEQVRLFADSLKLEESQYQDIRNKRQAGAVSRIDDLSVHQQVLNRRRNLRDAQADLAASLRSLSAVSGLLTDQDLSVPADTEAVSAAGAQMETPTILIHADPLEKLAADLAVDTPREFDDAHPTLLSLAATVESALKTAAALRSGYGPTVQLAGKISRDYPNGPVLESFNQKTFGVTASWPLFEGGKTPNETAAQLAQAESTKDRQAQTERDLKRDFNSARDRLQSLRYQENLDQVAVTETLALAQLVYDAYRAGRSTYLEVENANLRMLQARVQSATTHVEILMQVAVMDSLAKPLPEKEKP